MKTKHKKSILLALLFLVGLIITYSNHFKNGFHFDDIHTIVDNVHITNLKNIPEFFVNPQMFSSRPDHWGLRPIVTTSLAIDYWIAGGLTPFYFHLSTFIIYLFLCILLFFFYKKIFTDALQSSKIVYYAIITTALFAFHTVNAETINYIISRSDVLSTLCIVISFLIYSYYPHLRKWFLYSIPAILGVFAKETIITLPVLLFFYVLLFEKKIALSHVFKTENRKPCLNIIVSLIPLTVAILIVQFYTLSKAGSISGFSNPIVPYIQTQPYVWLHYCISFFLPFNLSADSDWKVISNLFDDRILIGFIFLVLLIYSIIKTSVQKETRPIAFGLIWFCVSLLPTSIMPLSEVMNDHRMFFAFIGLALSVVTFTGLLLNKYKNKYPSISQYSTRIQWGLVFTVLTLFAYGTYQRNKVWKNGETLWYDVTIKSPQNGRGLMNYGLTQMEKGNYEVALDYYKKALIYNPYYSSLHINIGITQGAYKRIQEAEESFKKGIQYDPHSDTPYYFYARFLKRNKRFQEAVDLAEQAYTINPYNLHNLYLLMELYHTLESWEKLDKKIQHTLQISENNTIALNYQNIKNKALSELETAYAKAEKEPNFNTLIDLSLSYYNHKNYQKCIEICYKALKLNSDKHHIAYNNICAAHTALGDYKKAAEACEKALQLKPDFVLAQNNLKYATSKL